MRYLKRTPRGYTLLELIVAVGLFSMVVTIVMGVYLALISYDRQARATNQLVANLSFALESMARNIRTGSGYIASGGNSVLFFYDAQGVPVRYKVRGDQTLGQCTGDDATTAPKCTDEKAAPLTDARIHIGELNFDVRGEAVAEATAQTFTIITVQGTIDTDAGDEIDFTIQTTAAQHALDLQ